MTRGGWISLTREAVVSRAMLAIVAVPAAPAGAPRGAGGRPTHYRLEHPNGGDDLTTQFTLTGPCGSAWAYGDRTPVKDCIGHALACLGVDRKQPGFAGVNGEWLNCKSIVADATGAQKFFYKVADELAKPGDVLVDDAHIGVIVRAKLAWWLDRDGDGKVDPGEEIKLDLLVSDCSPRHGRETAVGLGGRWSSSCIVARFKHLIDP